MGFFTLYTDTLVRVEHTNEDGETTATEQTWRDVCGLIYANAPTPYQTVARFAHRGIVAIDGPAGNLFIITKIEE